jgi:hypothetical protein
VPAEGESMTDPNNLSLMARPEGFAGQTCGAQDVRLAAVGRVVAAEKEGMSWASWPMAATRPSSPSTKTRPAPRSSGGYGCSGVGMAWHSMMDGQRHWLMGYIALDDLALSWLIASDYLL